MCQGYIPPQKKNRRPIDEIALKNKMKKHNLNTELTEMGVFSAVAGNQLPKINCKKEYYRLSSTCGVPRNHTNVQSVDAHV